MYADREYVAAKTSVKERLNLVDSGRRRQVSGKRQRQDDDKWEHDLFDDDDPQVPNRRIGARDLRLKLQKKSIQNTTQTGRTSVSGGIRDLREKLSGTINSHSIVAAPLKPIVATESSKPSRKVVIEAPESETKKVTATLSKKKGQQKVESVDSFLHSLGLEKYSITFQAEEVDMTALKHMNDVDLKALGIPMGPRKKILLALDSKV